METFLSDFCSLNFKFLIAKLHSTICLNMFVFFPVFASPTPTSLAACCGSGKSVFFLFVLSMMEINIINYLWDSVFQKKKELGRWVNDSELYERMHVWILIKALRLVFLDDRKFTDIEHTQWLGEWKGRKLACIRFFCQFSAFISRGRAGGKSDFPLFQESPIKVRIVIAFYNLRNRISSSLSSPQKSVWCYGDSSPIAMGNPSVSFAILNLFLLKSEKSDERHSSGGGVLPYQLFIQLRILCSSCWCHTCTLFHDAERASASCARYAPSLLRR